MVDIFMGQVERGEQHLLYDLNDVVNGVGGALGLFLGMSMLGIMDIAADWWDGRKKVKDQQEDVQELQEEQWSTKMRENVNIQPS